MKKKRGPLPEPHFYIKHYYKIRIIMKFSTILLIGFQCDIQSFSL